MARYDFGSGASSIQFTAPSLSIGDEITVVFGLTLSYMKIPDSLTDTGKTEIRLEQTSYGCTITVTSNGIQRYAEVPISVQGRVRVIAHGTFLTVYLQNRWAHTFHYRYVSHWVERYIAIKSSDNLTVTDVRRQELDGWREAIFIDLESSSMNAIKSVVLQRPVEIYTTSDGTLCFTFDPERDEVSIIKVKKADRQLTTPEDVASDAIVYFTNVGIVVDERAALEDGFITKLYRLPDLDQDAIHSAKIIMSNSHRRKRMHAYVARFNPALELGDISSLVYKRVDTQTQVQEQLITEKMRVQIGDGQFMFSVEGRNAD